ncbi:MAG: type II secretion system GspH family protein [Flavobacteriaceae bacterium]|nr:type II secretion system GspH family protein [Flavobacteriaceae bacterium]
MLIAKKVKSFTIAEMIVVLVLSGIVISIAILVLSMVQSQILGIQYNMEKQAEVQLLERTLWQDFNRYQLQYDKQNNKLFCSSPAETVVYTFTEDYIIRNQDTLKVSVQSINFYLDAEPIVENTIDAIEVELSKNFQEKVLFVYQNKDASHYMNLN